MTASLDCSPAPHGISRCTMTALMTDAEFPGLVEEYTRESVIAGMPPIDARLENYRRLESTGMLHVFHALKGNRMAGFIIVLTPILPHFNAMVAVVESFFVTADHRKGGTGLRLLKAAEDLARDMGSPGLLLSAPLGGRLAEVLPRRGYAETSRTFFKRSSP